ncbi:putative Diguanylate phosphodiesterase (EAL domain) [Legionella rubrilucens]|uniref:Putative Diguanylate phosphodiesterase (EAL domain) n=1 Tax=Legionella rubrilucens TaxID=458 RepID=A0A0W0XNA4_9GAMM|nr:HDOD domain-containing protein [Legionella rubrilucens]KTD46015.1 putative Diguanylate phosphodiesterase (EAL domain) [Legionella rubrilucens]
MEPVLGTLFARQEIFNSSGTVCAYELLYRDGDSLHANLSPANSLEGDKATSFVISHLFAHLDLELIIGSYPAYINFTRKHLIEQIPKLLPSNKIVIEILEDTYVDEELIGVVLTLAKRGYKFALDDFVYKDELLPLIAIADVIKIDVLNLSEAEVIEQLTRLKNLKFKGKLLAEKIETRQHFTRCQELGFHLFQGYFFNRPDLIHGEKISENKTHLLRLLTELHNPDIHMERVEEIILQIPKLSYRILRLANSAALYAGKKIDSLLDAIQQLGLIQIRDWISLLLVSSLDDVAHSVLEQTLIRAKMCQSLARQTGLAAPHQAYTVGMLSTLDAILNEPMPTLLAKISLSEELNKALLHRKGGLGQILSAVEFYERGEFEKLRDFNFPQDSFIFAYLDGIEYSNHVMQLLD